MVHSALKAKPGVRFRLVSLLSSPLADTEGLDFCFGLSKIKDLGLVLNVHA